MIVVSVVSAGAADLKTTPILKAPPAPIGYEWSGCHLGVQGGGAWGTSKHTQDDFRDSRFGRPMTGDFNVSGAEIGGTAGCDYQFNNWGVGIENDISWTNQKGITNVLPSFTSAHNTFETNAKWLDTQRLRLGVAWDRWFLYGTGGAAFAQEGINLCSPLGAACASASHTVMGWTAGVGVEYAFWGKWSVKLEYLHVDLGTSFFPELLAPAIAGGFGLFLARDVRLTDNIVRAGLDYKFDWPSPATARH
jgi:outer membrane immunogenic protein